MDAGYRVLIVDDDSDLLQSPDLVVTDLQMPGMDGVAVARRAREHILPLPVVLMTAYRTRETERRAAEVGVAIHLAKPFANLDLVRGVQRALAYRSGLR